VSFLSWDIEISQEIRIVRKNVRNKNFLFSRGKTDLAKITPPHPHPWRLYLYKRKLKWFLFMEKVTGISMMLSLFMLNIFQTGCDHALLFTGLSNNSPPTEVYKRKKNRRKTVTGVNNEIAILAAVAHDPHVSTRQLSCDFGMSQTSVCKVLKRNKYHPFHVSLHQELHDDVFQNRVTFCQWALQQIQGNPNFFYRVLFSDESSFTNHGTVNRHNMHYWSVENPHWLRQVEH